MVRSSRFRSIGGCGIMTLFEGLEENLEALTWSVVASMTT